MTFLFVHGTFGSPKEAWFPWLKHELESLGHTVIAPQFPTDDWSDVSKLSPEAYTSTQNLDSWMKTFENLLPVLSKDQEIIFVGHSLGPIFSLFLIEKYKLLIKNAFFVAPFLHPATEEESRITKNLLKEFYVTVF